MTGVQTCALRSNNGEMLSLWYGGMNEAYCRFQVKLQTSEPFSRSSEKDLEYNFARTEAWAWDDPYLRVSAYYLKGQGAIFLSLLMLLIVGAYIKILAPRYKEWLVYKRLPL